MTDALPDDFLLLISEDLSVTEAQTTISDSLRIRSLLSATPLTIATQFFTTHNNLSNLLVKLNAYF